MKKFNKFISIIGIILVSSSLASCSAQGNNNHNNSYVGQQQLTSKVRDTNASNQKLADLNYKSGQNAFVTVNHNHSDLKNSEWKSDHVNYSKLDNLGRTSHANVGTLDKQNVANDSLRTRQTVKPTGYQQRFVNNQAILNRGHMIAYSLSKGIGQNGKYNPAAESGDQNNRKNLFTQTAFSNQELQTIYESKVRNALKSGQKVIFSVQPIFQGDDKMAKGVHMQALSLNHKLNFNVYIFNVQPDVQFNYQTGASKDDKAMRVPTPANAPHFNDNQSASGRNTMYQGRRYGYRPYRHHHFIRDYAMYRVGKHLVRRHYEHKFYRHMYRQPLLHRRYARRF